MAEREFTATLDSVASLLTVLRPLAFQGDKQKALLTIAPDGLKVSVEHAKCVQAHAYLQSTLFREYHFYSSPSTGNSNSNTNSIGQEDFIQHAVHLSSLIDCLNIFGSSDTAPPTTASYTSTAAVCLSFSSDDPQLNVM